LSDFNKFNRDVPGIEKKIGGIDETLGKYWHF
jgi:hypothetical protein